jgi:complex iron-sulfur molybdoenzyme family reductase subunit beta
MSKRQLAMVMDLNKCIGCQTCTVACKTQWTNRNGREYMYWNNVETRPGDGYPKKWESLGGGFDAAGNLQDGTVPSKYTDYGVPWDYNQDEIMQGAILQAKSEPTVGPNWDEDVGAGEFPNHHFFYLPRICNHCSNPGCLAACPRSAIFKRDQDGIVLVDLARCEGYKLCIAGCPYKKIYFNPQLSKSEKCIFCFPRIEKGLPPACAQQCVGRIRFVGYLDDAEGQVAKLVNQYRVALPLHAEYGTQPNVYYVPPLSGPRKFDKHGKPIEGSDRIPLAYLESLFGPRVHEVQRTLEVELEKKKAGKGSELLDLLIAYKHADMFRIETKKPEGFALPVLK